jgi:hypothetical protein
MGRNVAFRLHEAHRFNFPQPDLRGAMFNLLEVEKLETTTASMGDQTNVSRSCQGRLCTVKIAKKSLTQAPVKGQRCS